MRKNLFVIMLCVCSFHWMDAQEQDQFHLKTVEPTQTVQLVSTNSHAGLSKRTLSDGKLAEIENLVSSTVSNVVDEVLDLVGGVDFSAFLEKLLPQKFKEILAEAGFWPIEGTALDVDMKEVSDLGKEVMDNISSLKD